MTFAPGVVGALLGFGTVWAMWMSQMLAERSGAAILLCAIAFFYPVFAVMDGVSGLMVGVHIAIFLGFSFLATVGFHRGLGVLALGIVAHGVFDLVTFFTGHPAPVWWPAFCGGLDIAAGLSILWLLRTQRITA